MITTPLERTANDILLAAHDLFAAQAAWRQCPKECSPFLEEEVNKAELRFEEALARRDAFIRGLK